MQGNKDYEVFKSLSWEEYNKEKIFWRIKIKEEADKS